jgi:hypothetical protein
MAVGFCDPFDDEDDEPDIELPHLEVEVTDPQVVGTILGPDGEPLHTVLDREIFPFGFCRTD